MSKLPSGIKQCEPARLFPVLSDTSKEGRTTAVFLSCVANVFEYGRALLATLGQRAGTRATIRCYTEVTFETPGDMPNLRPDGLIVLTVGSRQWTALIEAKVGTNELTSDQIEAYLNLAQAHKIDAVISISNQFSAAPQLHPLAIKRRASSKVALYHWSWMYVLTEADLLLTNQEILDVDQRYLLAELVRFLTHPSAGVKGFDAMPKAWGEMCAAVRAGAPVDPNSMQAQEVVGAWHQEVRDLSLIISRQVGVEVTNRLPRALIGDATARMKADLAELSDTKCLTASLQVPDAAAPIDVCVNVAQRTITSSAKIKAPVDKKSTKARINWVLRQLQKSPDTDMHIRLYWPGRGPHTQHTLAALRHDVGIADHGREKTQVSAIEICLVRELGGRFAQSKNFIKDLETAVPCFYESVMQYLKPWQPPAPRMREGRNEASKVTPAAIGSTVETHVEDQHGISTPITPQGMSEEVDIPRFTTSNSELPNSEIEDGDDNRHL